MALSLVTADSDAGLHQFDIHGQENVVKRKDTELALEFNGKVKLIDAIFLSKTNKMFREKVWEWEGRCFPCTCNFALSSKLFRN